MADKLSIEDRIKHFLRVAENAAATAEERDTANAQAERLMAKHLIERVSLDLASEQHVTEKIVTGDIWIAGGGGSQSYDLMTAMSDVARAMQCYPHYVDYRRYGRTWNAEKRRADKGILLKVTGFKSDVEAVTQLINSFLMQAPIALRQWQRSDAAQRELIGDRQWDWRISMSFLRGFGEGAASRIRATRKSVLNEYDDRTALVIVDRKKQVDDFMSAQNLRTIADRRKNTLRGRAAGHAAGQKADGANRQAALRENTRAVGR